MTTEEQARLIVIELTPGPYYDDNTNWVQSIIDNREREAFNRGAEAMRFQARLALLIYGSSSSLVKVIENLSIPEYE